VMSAIFAAGLILGNSFSVASLACLSFFAFKEFISIIPTRKIDRGVLFWAYLAIPVQYLFVSMKWYGMFIIWVPVYLFLSMPMIMVMLGSYKNFLRSAAIIHWGLMVTTFALSHVAYLLALPEKHGVIGGELVLFLVLLTQLNDVAQYLVGKSLGKRKVSPEISPNKTVAGFVGGFMCTMIAGCILGRYLTPCDIYQRLILSALIGCGGFVGDLIMSAVKRDLGLKDTGSMIPGHGGILDRVDSLFFSAPLFFHALYYLHY